MTRSEEVMLVSPDTSTPDRAHSRDKALLTILWRELQDTEAVCLGLLHVLCLRRQELSKVTVITPAYGEAQASAVAAQETRSVDYCASGRAGSTDADAAVPDGPKTVEGDHPVAGTSHAEKEAETQGDDKAASAKMADHCSTTLEPHVKVKTESPRHVTYYGVAKAAAVGVVGNGIPVKYGSKLGSIPENENRDDTVSYPYEVGCELCPFTQSRCSSGPRGNSQGPPRDGACGWGCTYGTGPLPVSYVSRVMDAMKRIPKDPLSSYNYVEGNEARVLRRPVCRRSERRA